MKTNGARCHVILFGIWGEREIVQIEETNVFLAVTQTSEKARGLFCLEHCVLVRWTGGTVSYLGGNGQGHLPFETSMGNHVI